MTDQEIEKLKKLDNYCICLRVRCCWELVVEEVESVVFSIKNIPTGWIVGESCVDEYEILREQLFRRLPDWMLEKKFSIRYSWKAVEIGGNE